MKRKTSNKASGGAARKRSRKRFVIVGLGARSEMFTSALLGPFRGAGDLVGLCDINPARMAFWNNHWMEKGTIKRSIRSYGSAEFEAMIAREKPDAVIVTTIDRTHAHYIVRAMELGCDVITEKPMTTDAASCQRILDTVARTGRSVRVTFNYRYAPVRSLVKEHLASGVIGEVKAVHFEWFLDTRHGADYFRRWHRDKTNSGGLMVHKATHHFDLVNWWLASEPETVFGLGTLAFYGRANAEARGASYFPARTTGTRLAGTDPFALDLKKDARLRALYLEAEGHDGYLRDQNVFGDGISIEDVMNVVVRYRSGAQMSYSLTAFAPYEGYRIAFTGTCGRLEHEMIESSHLIGAEGRLGDSHSLGERIIVLPHWKAPYEVPVPKAEGGHGGGDQRLLEDVFADRPKVDPLGRAADHRDGALSILTGIAANRSFETGQPVEIRTLLR